MKATGVDKVNNSARNFAIFDSVSIQRQLERVFSVRREAWNFTWWNCWSYEMCGVNGEKRETYSLWKVVELGFGWRASEIAVPKPSASLNNNISFGAAFIPSSVSHSPVPVSFYDSFEPKYGELQKTPSSYKGHLRQKICYD